MKVLKKLLLIGLFSLLFLITPQVNAQIADYSVEFKYTEELNDFEETYSDKYNNLIEYLSNNTIGTFIPTNSNYLISINMSTVDTNTWELSFVNLSYTGQYMYSRYGINSYNRNMYYSTIGSKYNIVFNDDNTINSYSLVTNYNGNFIDYNYDGYDFENNNYIYYVSDYYFITDFAINSELTTFRLQNATSTTNLDIPIKVGDTVYTPETTLYIADFFKNMKLENSEVGKLVFPELPSAIIENNYPYLIVHEGYIRPLIRLGYCKNNSLIGTGYSYTSITNASKLFICSSGDFYSRRLLLESGETFEVSDYDDLYKGKIDFSSMNWSEEYSSSDNYGIFSKYNSEKERLYILSDNVSSEPQVIYSSDNIYFNDMTNIILNKNVFNEEDDSVGDNEQEEDRYVCTNRNAVIGSLSNVSDFTLNIKGKNNALSKPLAGTFTIKNNTSSTIRASDFVITPVINNGVELIGGYSFYCDDEIKSCYLTYEYNTTDDIDEEIDVSLKVSTIESVSMPSFMIIYACTSDDNYSNISYTYTNNTTGGTPNTNESIENILGDSTTPDLEFFDNIDTLLPKGPIDSILMIPLEMLNALINALSGNCQPVTITLPYVDTDVELKCMNTFYEDIEATPFVTSVGLVASTLMLINYFIFLYNWIDGILRLEHKKVKAWGTGDV